MTDPDLATTYLEVAAKTPTNDLMGVTMVHMATGTVVTICDRKTDDTGWWVTGGAGLADSVIANGTWRPMSVVLVAAREILDA